MSTVLCSNVTAALSLLHNSSAMLMRWHTMKTIKHVKEDNKLRIYKHELQCYHNQKQKWMSTDTVQCIQCKLTHSGYYMHTWTGSYLQINCGTCAITLDTDTTINCNSIHPFILYSHSINPQKVTYVTMGYRIGQELQIYK